MYLKVFLFLLENLYAIEFDFFLRYVILPNICFTDVLC